MGVLQRRRPAARDAAAQPLSAALHPERRAGPTSDSGGAPEHSGRGLPLAPLAAVGIGGLLLIAALASGGAQERSALPPSELRPVAGEPAATTGPALAPSTPKDPTRLPPQSSAASVAGDELDEGEQPSATAPQAKPKPKARPKSKPKRQRAAAKPKRRAAKPAPATKSTPPAAAPPPARAPSAPARPAPPRPQPPQKRGGVEAEFGL